jgi:hypothetical protein
MAINRSISTRKGEHGTESDNGAPAARTALQLDDEGPPARRATLRNPRTPLATRRRRAIRSVGFVLVNVWLVYHLAAIVIAPWSVPPTSRLVQNAWRGIGPYVQALYLNHGYHYFAPEPGNSTLLSYVVEMPDGRVETGRIPNGKIWPRLLYHRHFMLTETLAAGEVIGPEVKAELVRSMARELCRQHGARRVTLSQVTHRLPSMEWVRAGGTLDDPSSYTEEPLGTFSCDEL